MESTFTAITLSAPPMLTYGVMSKVKDVYAPLCWPTNVPLT